MHYIYTHNTYVCVYVCTKLATSCRLCILWLKPTADGKCLKNSVSALNM